jgi:WD40 repeat protein
VAVSPDGKRVVSGSDDKTVRVWDLASGRCEATLEGHGDRVCSVAVSPDGKRVVSGSGDKTVRVWDLASGRCEATLEGHGDMVCSVAVSPDGKRVVSGSDDKTVRVWDLASGRCEATLEGHGGSGELRGREPGRQARGQRQRRQDRAGLGPGQRPLRGRARGPRQTR